MLNSSTRLAVISVLAILVIAPLCAAQGRRHVHPAQSPRPAITKLTPNQVAYTFPNSSGPDMISLDVRGTGFVQGTTVLFNGHPIPTTFVSSIELTAVLSQEVYVGDSVVHRSGIGSDESGIQKITVRNPDGRHSCPARFEVDGSVMAG